MKSHTGPGARRAVLVGGDDLPVVVRSAAERAGIAGGAGHVVADQVVRRGVVGLQVDVIGDVVALVGIAAGPGQGHVDDLAGRVVGRRRGWKG